MPACQIVEPGPNGRPCACGQRGCLETYASGSAVATIASERLNAGLAGVGPALSLSGEGMDMDMDTDTDAAMDREIGEGFGATPPATPSTPTHAPSPGGSGRKAPMTRSDSAVSLRIREFERRASAVEKGRSAPGSPSTPRAGTRSAAAPGTGLTGKVTAADVFSMAKQGDEVAVQVVGETCDYLGLACVNICRMLDPDAILLAGGLSKADGLLDKVRRQEASLPPCFLDRPTERSISAWPEPAEKVGVRGGEGQAMVNNTRPIHGCRCVAFRIHSNYKHTKVHAC